MSNITLRFEDPMTNVLKSHYFKKLSRLSCCICHFKFEFPVKTECGHTFCFKCISFGDFLLQKCPICDAKLSSKLKHNNLIQKELDSQKFFCENNTKGCLWIGFGSEFNEHYEKCSIKLFTRNSAKNEFIYNAYLLTKNNGLFRGLLVGEQKFGFGIIDLSNENVYLGNFRRNHLHGYGQIISRFNQYFFYGKWKKSQIVKGIGYILGKNFVFSGCVINSWFTYYSQISFLSRHLYFGAINKNLNPDGLGLMYHPCNGHFYYGFFKKGFKEGLGFKFILENFLGIDVCVKFYELAKLFSYNLLHEIYKSSLKRKRLILYVVCKKGVLSHTELFHEGNFPFEKSFIFENNIKSLDFQRQCRIILNPEYTHKEILNDNKKILYPERNLFNQKKRFQGDNKPFIFTTNLEKQFLEYQKLKKKTFFLHKDENMFQSCFIRNGICQPLIQFEEDIGDVLQANNSVFYKNLLPVPTYRDSKSGSCILENSKDSNQKTFDIEVKVKKIMTLNKNYELNEKYLNIYDHLFDKMEYNKSCEKIPLDMHDKLEDKYIRIRPLSIGIYVKNKIKSKNVHYNQKGFVKIIPNSKLVVEKK